MRKINSIRPLKEEPLFNKAIEINSLVRNVVAQLGKSRTIFELRDSHFIADRCLDALQLSAMQLPSSIAEAQVTRDYSKKIYFKNLILRMTEDLEAYSTLIKKHSKKTRSLNTLIRALKDFGSLHRSWELHLTRQN